MNPTLWLAVLLVTFLSRWWPRLICPDACGDDTYYHFFRAESIRQHQFKLPKRHPRFVLHGHYKYPPGYHYLLALFSNKWREHFEPFSSAISDTLLIAIFIWAAVQQLQPLGWINLDLFLLSTSFSLSPALTAGMGTGPRAYQGTPRTVGELLASAMWISYWQYWHSGSWLWMMIALFSAALLLNTSKFGGQVLLFSALVMAFILDSATLLIFPFFCAIGAVILSKGNYYNILLNQVRHLRLYATKIVNTHPMLIARQRWKLPKTPRDIYQFLMYENPYGALITKFLVLLIAVFIIFWNHTISTPEGQFLSAWLISAFVIFLVVSTPKFLFIGAAERYLEYALIPAFLLLGTIFSDSQYLSFALWGLVILHTLSYFFQAAIFIKRFHTPSATKERLELFDKLNEQADGIVLSLMGTAPWEIVYRTKHMICFSESLSMTQTEYDEFFKVYPIPNVNLQYYVEKYGVNLIPASKRVLEEGSQDDDAYCLDGFRLLYENSRFSLYEANA